MEINLSNNYYPTFELNIKHLRVERGLSRKRLSEISNVARSVISELESGKRDNPSCITLIKISNALGCKIDDLIEIRRGYK